VDLPTLIDIYMQQKDFLFFKIFNKIFVNHEQDHPQFDWYISSFTFLYDTLDNATAAYTAMHEWQENQEFDDPNKNVRILNNNGQRVEIMSQHFHIWRDKQTFQGLWPNCI